jgi:hypothetical protein
LKSHRIQRISLTAKIAGENCVSPLARRDLPLSEAEFSPNDAQSDYSARIA